MRSVLKPKDPNLIVDEVSRMPFEELASMALSATKLENFSVVEMILNANINHKVKSFILNECFVLACKHGDYQLLDKFVAYGSDVNVYDGKPLIMACAYGNIETVRVLLRLGADVHKRDDMAFEQACSNCQADVMRELILHGVKYNKKWDILLRNACRMDSGVVLVLLQNGADVNKGQRHALYNKVINR